MSTSIYSTNKNECRFYPVQCTQATFDNLTAQEGHLYFITDKKKIYLGKDGEKVPMAASSGIFYGKKPIEYENSGVMPNPAVNFGYDEIEGEDIPELDDLILNIGTTDLPDGCFYRVVHIADDAIETTRLTLQGTGGGAGGGGGDGGTIVSNFSVTSADNNKTNYTFSSEEDNAFIYIAGHSTDSTNYISKVECSFSKDITNEDSKFLINENLSHKLEEKYEINLAPYFDRMSTTSGTKIYVHVTDKYGTARYVTFTIFVIELQITTNEPIMLSETGNSYEYRLTPGGSTSLSSYEAIFEFYNNDNDIIEDYTCSVPIEKNQLNSQIPCPIDLSEVAHGAYTLKVYIQGISGNVKIPSNVFTHKLIRFVEGGDAILGILLPEKAEQYTPIPINYLLVYGDSIKSYNLNISLDNQLVTSESVTSGNLDSYELNIDKTGAYRLQIGIEELSIQQEYELIVNPYTGTLPVINMTSNLKTYLTARGRTNNSVNKEYWPDAKDSSLQGKLTGFHFRTVDGWLKDENNIDYLKVSQGGSVLYDAYSPYSEDPNTKGLTIELDFRLSGISDFNESLIECLSLNANETIKTGFKVTGDKFSYYVSGTAFAELNLVQNKRVRLTCVVDPSLKVCYIYINGIISGVKSYDASADFSNSAAYKGYLKINSTAGQVDVYNIRFYNSALNHQTVLNNYQASLDTLAMRQESFDDNQIIENGVISLKKIEDGVKNGTYKMRIPYAKIIGGYGMLKNDDGDMVMSPQSDSNVPALPTGKKDYRAIEISVHYPDTDYFKDYEDIEIGSAFEGGGTVMDAFGKVMTRGAWMYAQGTSSMEYPVKNLRVKTTGGKDKFLVQPGLDKVKLICFKADYMESSGSHNTGAGNFIDNVAYNNINIKTPGQEQFDNAVTCIKGHPCIIFWSPTGSKDPKDFQFIGKYNLNLDKATPEPFGFCEDEEDETFGYLTDENGELVLKDGKKQNSIYCFEFLDNVAKVCNFIHDATSEENPDLITEEDRYRDTWYGWRVPEDPEESEGYGWTMGFESRYPEDKTDMNDADVLWPLASWINKLYGISQAGNRDAAVAEFKENYWKYLDEDFTLAYYVITEALLMADSRVKNMMIATWGPEWRYRNRRTGEVIKKKPEDMTDYDSYFGYIWYPIFYDMDTMMGLDNVGDPTKNYFDEDTLKGVFNGECVLWDFVRDALTSKISSYYAIMEQNRIWEAEYVLPSFNKNQATLANETFYNEDAMYKYVNPYKRADSGVRLKAAQGSRDLDREYFINNRLKYLAGKYKTNYHQEKDRFFFRLTAPEKIDENQSAAGNIDIDKLNASVAAVPPSGDFTLKSAKTCYAGVKVGNDFTKHGKFINEQEITFNTDIKGANGSEVYITGISSLAEIGDLSDKYPYNINVNAMRNSPVRKLKLGNHNKHYYNYNLATQDSIDVSPMAYLEEFNMENCEAFVNGINFKALEPTAINPNSTPGCGKIKSINLLGSGTTTVELPIGGVLEELRLPPSITNLTIDSHLSLTPEGFTLGTYNYEYDKEENKDLGLPKYFNDYSRLSKVYIKNTPIDTYDMAKTAMFGYEVNNLDTYLFEGINWELSQADDFIIDVTGNVTGIKVLDELLKLNPGAATHEQSLIGSIKITVQDDSITRLDEYEIYNKYLNKYPNVTISYGKNVSGFVPAKKVRFYRLDSSNLNSDFDITTKEYYYSALTNSLLDLDDLIHQGDFTLPAKASTVLNTYTFSGVWVDWDPVERIAKGRYYQADVVESAAAATGAIIDISGANNFIGSVPSGDMYLVPEYIELTRMYRIDFYDEDGTYLTKCEGAYNTNVAEACEDKPEYYYIYKDDIGLVKNDYERYTFKGWISEKDHDELNQVPNIYDLSQMLFTRDMKVYAFFKIEDARNIASDNIIFNMNTTTISIKDEYREIVGGKITLPSKNKQGVNFVSIGNFRNMDLVTEVYFLPDAVYTAVGDDAFHSNMLTSIYLPDTIITIGDSAFCDAFNLININLNDNITTIKRRAFYATDSSKPLQVRISKLPKSLTTLEMQAFYNGGSNITVTEIPDGLNTIESQIFLNDPNVNITYLGPRDVACEIKSGAFQNTGKNNVETSLFIHSPWTINASISAPFEGAFNSNLRNIYVHAGLGDASNVEGDNEIVQMLFGPNRSYDEFDNVDNVQEG